MFKTWLAETSQSTSHLETRLIQNSPSWGHESTPEATLTEEFEYTRCFGTPLIQNQRIQCHQQVSKSSLALSGVP